MIDVREKKTLVSSKWTFHTGRITSLAFSPNGKRIASAGLDESLFVWETEKTLKNTAIRVSTKVPYFAEEGADLSDRMLIQVGFRVSLGSKGT